MSARKPSLGVASRTGANPSRKAPVRKITNRGGVKFISRFQSLRAGHEVIAEGLLELDFLYMIDDQPSVIDIQHQPHLVLYSLNPDTGDVHLGHEKREEEGKTIKRRRCYPDFEIRYAGGRIKLVEVKTSSELLKEKVRVRLRAMKLFAESMGYDFEVMTEYDIRTPELKEAKKRHFSFRISPVPIHWDLSAEGLVRSARKGVNSYGFGSSRGNQVRTRRNRMGGHTWEGQHSNRQEGD